MTIKILLADDHTIIRQGIRNMLSAEINMDVVAEAGDGREAIKLAKKNEPDIVVMDISMPKLNGIDATKIIKEILPETKIIILSVNTGRRFVKEVIKAGVSGYLIKQCAIDELVNAINCVYKGKSYLSPEITQIVMKDYVNKDQEKLVEYVELTLREREILQLVAEGLTSENIASRLNISVKTVSSHRRTIMKKLSVSSVAELTLYAVKEGIISIE